ncbi:hypothetical protein L1049_014354 [Liquidambar formosana]|uniref:MLO-like protein n=1 Tax=Liquidambar formosana TaxID=63359 RepID=A0AAP0WV71_LIQFO
MALQLNDQHSVIRGAPLVKPNDNLFWFSDPKLVLILIQYTLFMNAFELAFFVWVTLQFGMKSCYHERLEIIIIRVVLAVTVQVLCSYITLPLYALVTQMGSQFKKAMLEEEVTNVLRQWHTGVREKRKKQQDVSQSLHDNSSTIRTNTATTSPDLSYSHPDRSPSFSTITVSPTEIVEDHQEIAQHEAAPARVAPNMVQIEMSEVTKPIS